MIKIFIILLISIFFIANASSPTKIRNTLISRTIKLESQLSEQTITITFINGGEKAINKYNYIVAHQEGKLSFIGAENDSGKRLKVNKIEGKFSDNGNGYDNYEIELDTQVEPKKAKKLIISLIFTETMSPFPKQIFQDENQLVIYQGNAYVYSLYRSDQQKTTIYLASDRIESYSKDPKPVVHSGKTITFGNYQSLQKFSLKPIKIHFENNMPFTRVKKLEREYLISLWGSISVEERWEIEHFGAKLKKGFSRFDFVRTGHRGGSVSSFHQFLPKESTNIYYRDIIGNISTSHVFPRKDGSIDFHITPRFVLFGGWRVVFKTGYYLPVSSFLSISSPQTYNLRSHLFDSVDGFPIDSLTVRVVLPEGSSNPKIDYPFPIDSQGLNGVKKTYLDTSGRPVYEFTKTNLVSQHSVDFDLSFSVEGVSIFKKPFLFIFGIYVILLGVIFYARWERSIIPPDSHTFVENQKQVENLLLELKDLHCERAELYSNVEKQILKAPKVISKQGIENAIGNLEKDIVTLNKDFAGIENDFRKYNENIAKQLRTLANHEKTRQEIFINTAKSLLQQETEKKREEIQDSFRKKCDEISEVIDKCIHDITDELDIN